ncbi:hypothetical protein ESCO_006221 [Escovopsis weberi]|uniref:Uncharacterized protein n=1 Tax=Escovopsis weberi TaxID=150374 RepID=A0A0M8MZS9_ESCWE|nr:hypothetical protein ESCO_006221 [Escovopsis weberi]
MAVPEIVLYHYPYSPYARRIVWYLALRGIPYKQCLQPPMLPRPDVAQLGIRYRRIPILSIGRDVYLDTRLQLEKLEALDVSGLPHAAPRLGGADPAQRATQRLLGHYMMDAGVFGHGVTLLPTSLPVLQDPAYFADRSDLLGAPLSAEGMRRARPEAELEMQAAFELLEGVLADGRAWVLGGREGEGEGQGPSLADIEAVWPLHWLSGIPGALPAERISGERFPRTFAWIGRFQGAVSRARRAAGRPEEISGAEAARLIEGSAWHEGEGENANNGKGQGSGAVDEEDPVVIAEGLAEGDGVVVWPTDTGRGHREEGRLVRLDGREAVIEVRTASGVTVRVHAPRHGFRVKKQAGGARL